MSKGLEALKEIATQSVEALIEKQEPLRTQKINELLETRQFKCIEKELKALEIIKKHYDCETTYDFLDKKLENKVITQEEYDLLKEVLE